MTHGIDFKWDILCVQSSVALSVYFSVRSQRSQQGRIRATAAIQPIRQQNEDLPGALLCCDI